MTTLTHKQPGFMFLFRWMFNNEFALTAGYITASLFGRTSILSSQPATAISTEDILGGLFLGLVVGFLQSAQLKPWLGDRLAWMAASTLGWTLATLWFRKSLPEDIGLVLLMFGMPLVLGILQWLILREAFERAGWWIAFSYAGVILMLVWFVDLSQRYATASSSANPLGIFIPLVLFPLPYSLITGLGLRWMIRIN